MEGKAKITQFCKGVPCSWKMSERESISASAIGPGIQIGCENRLSICEITL